MECEKMKDFIESKGLKLIELHAYNFNEVQILEEGNIYPYMKKDFALFKQKYKTEFEKSSEKNTEKIFGNYRKISLD